MLDLLIRIELVSRLDSRVCTHREGSSRRGQDGAAFAIIIKNVPGSAFVSAAASGTPSQFISRRPFTKGPVLGAFNPPPSETSVLNSSTVA